MGRAGKRARWVLGLALGVLAAGGAGLWWAWPRLVLGPLPQARAAYAKRDWLEASRLARLRLKAVPDDPEALRLLARASARLGRDDLAQELYGRFLQAGGKMRAEDRFLTANGFTRQNRIDLALMSLTLARDEDPNHPETLGALAKYHARADDLAKAVPLAEHMARQPGWEAAGLVILGMLQMEQNDPARAAATLERAFTTDPKLRNAPVAPATVRKALARAWLQVGQSARAREALQAVLAEGTDPEALWLLSRAALQEGAINEASEARARAHGSGGDQPQAPEPAPYVGSARCAHCHASISRSQQSSLHAKTFRRADQLQDVALPDGPIVDPFNQEVVHTWKRQGDRVRAETRVKDRDAVYRALVEFACGSGDRGLTLVGRDEAGTWRELRMSRYNDGSGWDRTTGHWPTPFSPDGYLGKWLDEDDLRRCLFCHFTNFHAALTHTGPEWADHAIGCERCHGPGGHHLKAVALGFDDLAIGQPKQIAEEQVVRLCAQCHSPRNSVVTPETPGAVRAQGSTLTWSKCFTASRGAFGCTTCHNPHRDAEHSDTYYEAKCLGCHSETPPPSARAPTDGTRPIALAPEIPRVVCPVNPSQGCIGCHMPVVKGAIPHSPFTDHHIRVHPDPDHR